MTRARLIPAAATLLAVLLCWPAWWLAGWLVDLAGLGAVDILARALLVIALLGALARADASIARLAKPQAGRTGEQHG